MNQPNHQTDPRALKRPDPDDIIYSELNIERWSGLWATRDSDEPRTLRRTIRYPDGSRFQATLTVAGPPGTGTLTTETLKYYSALLKLRQEAWGPRGETAPADRRMAFSVRNTTKLLRPGTSKRQRWGGRTLASAKRHIRKLAGVTLRFSGSFWDAPKKRRRTFESGFTILSDYLIAEERRFRKGTVVQLPLEFGYVRFNPWLEDNLQAGYIAPFYFSERAQIRAPLAQQLYNHLNLAMVGTTRYQRRLKALCEDDLPDLGTKYPIPAQRRRALERTFKYLRGRKITTGILTELALQPTTDGSDHKLVVRKEPFPHEAPFPAPRVNAPSQQNAMTEKRRSAFHPHHHALVEDILEVTEDPANRSWYELVAQHVPEPITRRILSEVKGEWLEHGRVRNRGALFTHKIKAWCAEEGRAPFWRPSSASSDPPR